MNHSSSARPRARGLATAIPLVVLLLGLAASPVLAHAELETSVPAEGASVEAGEVTAVLTFTLPLVADRSTLRVLGPDGQAVADGAVDADDPTVMRAEFVADAPGAYEMRWTAIADDGHEEVERGIVRFTVTEPPPTPSPSPTPAPSASATPEPTASPTASPTLAPSPSPDPGPTAGGGGSEVLIPIIVAGLLIGGAAAYLLRRGRPA